ncbi:uncharacterized protein EV420DRAFT_1633848 [Desarmillaria tabescens]|uniref:F-box domain-containing protein n=1 Tax=Armillaria tabescens TaxID=1929756 RepID=A0AA39NPK2_ARMTA|nr:uncharacterized protein EV420DRAFT_1633848 [Desarmillaria tabescens]KAK0469431.1 hypothetical protein EV420DRAFT_1633848 [Desarmillaria tabescens]
MTSSTLCEDVLLKIADTVGGSDLETLLSLSLSCRTLQQACRPWTYRTIHINPSHPPLDVAGFCRRHPNIVRKATTLSFQNVVFEYGVLRMLLDTLGSVVKLKFRSMSMEVEDGAPALLGRIKIVTMDQCDFSRLALRLILGNSCIEEWSLTSYAGLHRHGESDSPTSPLPLARLRGLSLDLSNFQWSTPRYYPIIQSPLNELVLLLERARSLVTFEVVFTLDIVLYVNRIIEQNVNTLRSLSIWQEAFDEYDLNSSWVQPLLLSKCAMLADLIVHCFHVNIQGVAATLSGVRSSVKRMEFHVYCIRGALWRGYLNNEDIGFRAFDISISKLASTKLVLHIRLEGERQLRLVKDWVEGFLACSIKGGMLSVEWTAATDCHMYQEYV